MNSQSFSHLEILPLGAVRPIGWMKAQLLRDLADGFAGCLDTLTERAATDLFAQRIEASSQQFAWWDSETRGALQYVLPLAHTLQPIKDYALERFHDYNVLPQNIEQICERVLLDEGQPDYGLTFETDPVADVNHGWEQSPLGLKTGATLLVPLGCTILRRASFPLKKN